MIYLDLHLALVYFSSTHSSFRLDFMLTELENAYLFLDGWAFKFFIPGIYTLFPRNIYANIFGFKIHKVRTGQKWCNYAHVEKNRLRSRNLFIFEDLVQVYTQSERYALSTYVYVIHSTQKTTRPNQSWLANTYCKPERMIYEPFVNATLYAQSCQLEVEAS